jgi:hypothetical protein
MFGRIHLPGADNHEESDMPIEPDLTLKDDKVIADACDFCLQSSSRRTNKSPNRRALVHDPNDGLTINWDGDYPGGVTIRGKVTISDGLTTEGPTRLRGGNVVIHGYPYMNGPTQVSILSEQLVLRNNEVDVGKKIALSHCEDDTLVLNKDQGYGGGVRVEGDLELPGNVFGAGKLRLNQGLTVGTEQLSTLATNTTLSIRNDEIELVTTSMDNEGHAKREVLDLVSEVKSLRARVQELEDRISGVQPS